MFIAIALRTAVFRQCAFLHAIASYIATTHSYSYAGATVTSALSDIAGWLIHIRHLPYSWNISSDEIFEH